MPPKNKVRKYDDAALAAMERAQLVQAAREEREAGRIPMDFKLSSKSSEISAVLKKIKVVSGASGSSSADSAAGSGGTQEFSESNAQRHGHESHSTGGSTKVDPPSKLCSDPNTSAFRLWRKEVDLWLKCHKTVQQEALVSRLLTCLADSEKELVLSVTFGENVTCDELLKRLQDRYGGSAEVERQGAIKEFRTLARGSKSLQSFISVWETTRAKAVELGVIPELASEQDVWDLLEAAQVSTAERAQVLRELELRKDLAGELEGPEKYNVVKKTLKTMALSFELESGGKKKEEKSVAVLIAEGVRKGLAAKGQGKGQGKGKASKKGGDAKKDMACYECGKTGHFAADCWSKATGKSKGQKGKGKGKGKKKWSDVSANERAGGTTKTKPCWQWQKEGRCTHGQTCKFSHADPASGDGA